MYNKLSDAISGMSFNFSLAAMDKGQAEKALEELKTNPDLAKELLNEINKLKPGQRPAVTAGMKGPLKTLLMSLMLLAPAAFADEGGLNDLKMMLKNPSKINVEQVNKIQDKSEEEAVNKQLKDMKEIAKATKPGAIIPTPQTFNLKGVKVTINTQGQANLAQKATKFLNELGQAGANQQTITTQAKAFAQMIQGLHS